jgi:hypothetical protein
VTRAEAGGGGEVNNTNKQKKTYITQCEDFFFVFINKLFLTKGHVLINKQY